MHNVYYNTHYTNVCPTTLKHQAAIVFSSLHKITIFVPINNAQLMGKIHFYCKNSEDLAAYFTSCNLFKYWNESFQ